MNSKKPVVGYFICNAQALSNERLPIHQGDNVIGRVPQKANIVVKDPQVSSSHAKIIMTHKNIILVDLGSKNGTFLDLDTKQRLQQNCQFEILQRQQFALGEVICYVERLKTNTKKTEQPQTSKEDVAKDKRKNILFELDDSQQQSEISKHPPPVQKHQNEQASEQSSLIKNKKIENQYKGSKKVSSKLLKGQSESQMSDQESSISVPKLDPKKQLRQKQARQKEKQKKIELQKAKQLQRENEARQKQLLKQKKQKQQLEAKAQKAREQKLRKQQQAKQKKDKKQKQKQTKLKEQKQRKQRQERQERQRQQQEALQKKAKLEQEKRRKQSQKLKLQKAKSKKEKQEKKKNDQSQQDQKVNEQIKQKRGKKSKVSSKQKQQSKQQKSISIDKADKKKRTSKDKEKQTLKTEIQKKLLQQKESKKPNKLSKQHNDENIKKRGRNVLQVDKSSKDDTKSKQKNTSKQIISAKTQHNKQPSQKLVKTRKRVPEVSEQKSKEHYNTRNRLLPSTRFLVSGAKITFYLNPMLMLAENQDDQYDVLVMETYSRTVKLLVSIAKGVPVVKKSWLVDSELYKKTVDVERYWLEHPEDKWLIKKAVEKVQGGQKVFQNMKFMVASPLHLKQQSLQKIIYLCGGELIHPASTTKTSKTSMREVYVLVGTEYTQEQLKKAKAINKDKVYTVQMILQGCLTQELQMENYKVD